METTATRAHRPDARYAPAEAPPSVGMQGVVRPTYPNRGRWGDTTRTVTRSEEIPTPDAVADEAGTPVVDVPAESPEVARDGGDIGAPVDDLPNGHPSPRRRTPPLTRCGYCGEDPSDGEILHIPGCAYELPPVRRVVDAVALKAMVSQRVQRRADPALVPTRVPRCGWCQTPADPDRGPDAQHKPTCRRRVATPASGPGPFAGAMARRRAQPDRVNGASATLPGRRSW